VGRPLGRSLPMRSATVSEKSSVNQAPTVVVLLAPPRLVESTTDSWMDGTIPRATEGSVSAISLAFFLSARTAKLSICALNEGFRSQPEQPAKMVSSDKNHSCRSDSFNSRLRQPTRLVFGISEFSTRTLKRKLSAISGSGEPTARRFRRPEIDAVVFQLPPPGASAPHSIAGREARARVQ
jgi:hypothetical protein